MLNSINIFWKLGLGVIGVGAIFFIVFLINENHRIEMSGGSQLSAYVKEYEKDGYVSLYNQREKKLTLERLDWISHSMDDSRISVYSKNLKRGFFDINTGEPLTDPGYDKAWNFYEGVGAVEKDGYITFLNENFQPAITPKFKIVRASDDWPEAIRFRSGQCVLALTPDSIGVIDKKGEWILEPKYQMISELSTDNCRVVKENGYEGVVDYNGKVLIEPIYDAIRLPNPGVANVAKDGFQKQITYTGFVLQNFIFDDIKDFENPADDKFTMFEINGKYGVMKSNDCKIIIPALYDEIESLSGNRFKALLPSDENVQPNQGTRTSAWIILDENNNILTERR